MDKGNQLNQDVEGCAAGLHASNLVYTYGSSKFGNDLPREAKMSDNAPEIKKSSGSGVPEEPPGIPPWLNKLLKWILSSPFHGPVSKSIMLITFIGRKSGKQYTTPVTYYRAGNIVTLFTNARWWKNLVGGAPVTLRIRGKDLQCNVETIADDKETIAAGLREALKQNPRDVRYYGVTTFDEDGYPDPDEVARGAQDVVMVRGQLI